MKKPLDNPVNKYNLGILLLCACVFQGCTMLYNHIDRPLQFDTNDFHPDHTHISTVLEHLGPPAKMSALGKGAAFLYEYTLITERQLAVTFGQGLSSLIKFSYAHAKADRQSLLLLFDAQGILTSYVFQDVTEDVGSGISASFVYRMVSLVDTSNLQEAPAVFHWGSSLLRPLREMLNVPYSLERGQNGLELKGTTKSVGQHSLEMRSGAK